MEDRIKQIVHFDVGGQECATLRSSFPPGTLFHSWFVTETKTIPFIRLENGRYFVDRDPQTFTMILNYFRLSTAGQMWEAAMPKDPDRLALLTQEAEYFQLHSLRDQAISLLHSCCNSRDSGYVSAMLSKSASCPQGFTKLCSDE